MDVVEAIRQVLAGFRQDGLDYTDYLNVIPTRCFCGCTTGRT